jgi:hypothetical protein
MMSSGWLDTVGSADPRMEITDPAPALPSRDVTSALAALLVRRLERVPSVSRWAWSGAVERQTERIRTQR